MERSCLTLHSRWAPQHGIRSLGSASQTSQLMPYRAHTALQDTIRHSTVPFGTVSCHAMPCFKFLTILYYTMIENDTLHGNMLSMSSLLRLLISALLLLLLTLPLLTWPGTPSGCAAKSHQELPWAPKELPGATRSCQEHPGAAKSSAFVLAK